MYKIIFFIFWTQLSLSQKIGVYDKTTKKGVPYAIVFLDQEGLYTDKDGLFKIDDVEFDSISISHLNYEVLKLTKNDISDSIFLETKIDVLNEINITNYSESKSKRLKTPRRIFNAIMKEHTEIITCFCPKKTELYKTIILKLRFKLSNKKYHYDLEKIAKHNIRLRLNLYSNLKQFPIKEIYSYYPEVFNLESLIKANFILEFDLENKPIKFSNDGFCVGLEHLEFYDDKNRNDIKELFFELHRNNSKFYDAKTYMNYPLLHNDSIISYNDFHKEYILNADKAIFSALIPEMIVNEMRD